MINEPGLSADAPCGWDERPPRPSVRHFWDVTNAAEALYDDAPPLGWWKPLAPPRPELTAENAQAVVVWLVERMDWMERRLDEVAEEVLDIFHNDRGSYDAPWPPELAQKVAEVMSSGVADDATAEEIAEEIKQQVIRPQLFEQYTEERIR